MQKIMKNKIPMLLFQLQLSLWILCSMNQEFLAVKIFLNLLIGEADKSKTKKVTNKGRSRLLSFLNCSHFCISNPHAAIPLF